MKTFKDLLVEMDMDEFVTYLKAHEDFEELPFRCMETIEEMLQLKPTETSDELVINHNTDELFGAEWEVTFVRNGKHYALDFSDWEDVLGMIVDVPEIEKRVDIRYFLGSVLLDLTFDGYTKEVRDRNLGKIAERMDTEE